VQGPDGIKRDGCAGVDGERRDHWEDGRHEPGLSSHGAFFASVLQDRPTGEIIFRGAAQTSERQDFTAFAVTHQDPGVQLEFAGK